MKKKRADNDKKPQSNKLEEVKENENKKGVIEEEKNIQQKIIENVKSGLKETEKDTIESDVKVNDNEQEKEEKKD